MLLEYLIFKWIFNDPEISINQSYKYSERSSFHNYDLYRFFVYFRQPSFRFRDVIEKNVLIVWHFNKNRSPVIFACSPIGNKLRIVSDVGKKAASLFVERTRASSNCFVIREHTIETESSRGLFGVKLLVLAALGGPLVAELRYFYR